MSHTHVHIGPSSPAIPFPNLGASPTWPGRCPRPAPALPRTSKVSELMGVISPSCRTEPGRKPSVLYDTSFTSTLGGCDTGAGRCGLGHRAAGAGQWHSKPAACMSQRGEPMVCGTCRGCCTISPQGTCPAHLDGLGGALAREDDAAGQGAVGAARRLRLGGVGHLRAGPKNDEWLGCSRACIRAGWWRHMLWWAVQTA